MINPLSALGNRRLAFLPKHFFQVELNTQYLSAARANTDKQKIIETIENNSSLQGRYSIHVSGLQLVGKSSTKSYMSYYTIILGFELKAEAYMFMLCQ